jgi:hypothetical protein
MSEFSQQSGESLAAWANRLNAIKGRRRRTAQQARELDRARSVLANASARQSWIETWKRKPPRLLPKGK